MVIKILSKMTIEEHKLNIGKRCIITESVITSLNGKEGIILDVSGNDIDGFRYKVQLDNPEPLNYSPLRKQSIFYPPSFLCDIL
jgi:hypothetical protein